MSSQTTKVKLLAQETDSSDYTTYVFEVLDNDEQNRFEEKYIMCTRWPNWDHRVIKNGEEGFLSFSIIIAGVNTWYDGFKQVPYKYSNIQFIKFVKKQPDIKHKFKL